MKPQVGDLIEFLDDTFLDWEENGIILGIGKGYRSTILEKHPKWPDAWLIYCPNGIIHFTYNGNNPGWWFYHHRFKVINKQMQFDFMKEE